MKKALSILLASLFLFAFASHAESIDLSDLSFDELLTLRKQVDAALWASDGWQEVEVPAGIYQIGVDIPAGHWTITPVFGQNAIVTMGYGLGLGGASVNDILGVQFLTAPTSAYSTKNNVSSVSWQLEDEMYISIKDSAVLFTPFTGHDLGFK